MRATILLVLLLAAAPNKASAAGFTCTVLEKRIEIELDASIDLARGSAIYDVGGHVKVRTGAKDRFATVDLDASHVAQYWSEDDELRVKLVRIEESVPESESQETGGDAETAEDAPVAGSVDLSLVAHRDSSSGEFEGTYKLASSLIASEASGSVVCIVERE